MNRQYVDGETRRGEMKEKNERLRESRARTEEGKREGNAHRRGQGEKQKWVQQLISE